ncbi:hypothetical protein CMO90_00910 [Candidatus Woesearchaeota archaeon]|jgi:hypothetical protein|nr:hypothetical protein [Candidatus Woesearchaeota archaeon]|tara:strand:- start:67 stop:273 length:207 start_codon:yes stop_codon:yes gene_type:complete
MTKKKKNNFKYYNNLINQIQNTRKKNNKNWMDLLRITFKHNPAAAKRVLRKIFNEDKRINKLVKKLTK